MNASRVVLASDNPGKLAEFSSILAGVGWQIVSQGALGVPPADEPHITFVENALAKARHASQHTGLPALADDSGLCVDALGGAPGVYSARYAARQGKGSGDADNNRCLVAALQGHTQRDAAYVAVLVYVRHAQDPCPIIVEGVWHGQIVDTPQGTHGFGYDPHFYIPALNATAAMLPPDIKNQHSHRGQALQSLIARVHATGRSKDKTETD